MPISNRRRHKSGRLEAEKRRAPHRIAFSVLILRRTWRRDDRRAHQRALAHEHASPAQERVDLLEDRLRQLVLFEQAPELQQRCRVRHLFAREIDSPAI